MKYHVTYIRVVVQQFVSHQFLERGTSDRNIICRRQLLEVLS